MKDENNLYQKTIIETYTELIQSEKKAESFLVAIVETILDDTARTSNQCESSKGPFKHLMDHLSI